MYSVAGRKMNRNVGGRVTTIVGSKTCNIVLGQEQRDIIKEKKGDSSMSSFIRDCIDLRFSSKEGTEQEEVKQLKEKLSKQAKQLKQYEQGEQRRQKVNEEQLAYISKRYQEWEQTSGLVNNHSRFNWAQGCVKGLPISAEDALSYLQCEGLFALE